jgi:hypothetical protein
MKEKSGRIMLWGVFWLISFGLFSLQPAWAATNISATYKYAWSENVGWQNWRATNAQATVGTTYLVGYVWAENIGWIKLGSTPTSGSYANDSSTNWGVNRNSSTGALSGYAWSENVGWINFNPTHGGVTIATGTGKFDGYAWGENIGWIHFQNASPIYYVQQDGALVVNLISFRAGGLADRVHLAWETATEVNNAGFHIWRAPAGTESYERLTGSLIPAEGGPAWGAAYTYNDQDVKAGRTYRYLLEDIDSSGVSSFHDPASAWAGVVNIKVNGSDGPVAVAAGKLVSVTVSAQTEDKSGASMEWWVAADTPFGWYSYDLQGWISGIENLTTAPLCNFTDLPVLNAILQPGDYVFYESVKSQANSGTDAAWCDGVEVRVE